MKILFNNLIHLFAIILFFCITVLYCWPILKGEKINQSDYKQFLGMSKEIVDFRHETAEEALWTNSMFGGMPAYQISVHYKNNILVHIDKFFQLYLPRPIGIIFLYFIGFYILLLSLKIPPNFSILGALMFGLSTYLFIIIEVGHNTKAHSFAYIAPSIAGMLFCFKKSDTPHITKLLGFFLSFLFLGLHLRANHLQITYYFLFIIFAFWINFLIQSISTKKISDFFKSSFLFFCAALLAVSINLGNIWSTYEYSKYTTRGTSELTPTSENNTSGLDKDYATSYSYGKLETFNLLFPNFVGGPSIGKLSEKSNLYQSLRKNGVSKRDSQNFIQSVPLYFGPQQFTAGPVYIGAVVWLLFFIGLFTIKKPIKWILLFLMIISLLLAWGKYFPLLTNFLLDYFPLYNKFRTVSMILVIVEFVIPLLGILGLHRLLSSKEIYNERGKILIKSTLILSSISIFFYLVGPTLFDFSSQSDTQFQVYPWLIEALIKDRIDLFQSDILRSLILICLTSLCIYFYLFKYYKNISICITILSLLVLSDMWFVNKRYFNTDDFINKSKIEIPFKSQKVDNLIKQDTSFYRVYNLNERLDQGARTSYFHHSLGGYHGAKLGKYQEIIDNHLVKGNMNVINMLNTKYIISSDKDNIPLVQQNTEALGNAWFIRNINWVDNADEELTSLSRIDPKMTVSINKKHRSYVDSVDFSLTDKVELSSYSPNRLVYKVKSEKSNFIVFSEIYYPKGWIAYVDGVQTTHFPVNYILRGLVIPKGGSEIVFEFKPKSFFVSNKIAFLVSGLLILTGFLLFFRLFLYLK